MESKKLIRIGMRLTESIIEILKEELKDLINKRAAEEGVPNLLDMIADETTATTEEEVIAHLQKTGHPALAMPPIIG